MASAKSQLSAPTVHQLLQRAFEGLQHELRTYRVGRRGQDRRAVSMELMGSPNLCMLLLESDDHRPPAHMLGVHNMLHHLGFEAYEIQS